jgi:hypothetical protein
MGRAGKLDAHRRSLRQNAPYLLSAVLLFVSGVRDVIIQVPACEQGRTRDRKVVSDV